MSDAGPPEDFYTLLGVRPDGVAPIVALIGIEDADSLQVPALAILKEHASCEAVEVWRGSQLVERIARP